MRTTGFPVALALIVFTLVSPLVLRDYEYGLAIYQLTIAAGLVVVAASELVPAVARRLRRRNIRSTKIIYRSEAEANSDLLIARGIAIEKMKLLRSAPLSEVMPEHGPFVEKEEE